MEKYLMIQIDTLHYFIKYQSNGVSIDEIEDDFASYLESPAAEDSDDIEIIEDVMSSFDNMNYEILDFDTIEI